MVKKIFLNSIIFLFILCFTLIISPINLDEIWNYGFTSNIVNGLIPYKDFNMVITPFYPFIMSILMHIFGNNMLFFHIENAILVLGIILLIKELVKDKVWFILPLLIWPMNMIYPSYNLLVLFLVLLLIYLEEKEVNDTIIGLLCSIIFLTKQSIGIPIFITSLFYITQKDKRIKRIESFLIPILFFTIILIITNSFYPFIDYCFLGLFDFNHTNSHYLNGIFFLSLLFLVLLILLYRKDKNKNYFYGLAFLFMIIPIFDYYHFILFFILFIVLFLHNHKELSNKWNGIGKILLGIIIIVSTMNFSIDTNIYPNNLSHFEYRYLTKEYIDNTNEVNDLIKKYHNVIIIGPDSYYHKLILNEKINELDLINTGNWGYHGSEKLLKEIKEVEKDSTFFVNKSEIRTNTQTDQQVIKYITENMNLIEDTKFYQIYQIKD